MIEIKYDDFCSIIDYLRGCLPEEGCGMLAGVRLGELKRVEKVYFAENAEHSCVHYSMCLSDRFNAARDMRKNGLEPVGCFHSHTLSGIDPSDEDIRLAYNSNISYVIFSLAKKDAEAGSFIIEKGKAYREELAVIGNEI